MELAFRQRERRDLQSVFGARRRQTSGVSSALSPRFLTGIPANPTVGSVVDINANLSGNSCSDPKQLHGAVVVAVLQHTIVLSDTLSPTGGYTNAELTSFGQAFDTLSAWNPRLNCGPKPPRSTPCPVSSLSSWM